MKIKNYLFLIALITSISNHLIGQNFITVWDLSKNGSANNSISIGGSSTGSVNYKWKEISPGNDSGSGSFVSNQLLFTGLPSNAIIRLEIEPTNFLNISISNSDDKDRLIDIEQWGTTAWTSMNRAFYGCRNLQISATDIPDLSLVTDMSNMFRDCEKLNTPSNINSWNTANVKNMSYLFTNAYDFNQNLSNWNTSQVTNFSNMFVGAFKFNQDIGNWNTSNATNMSNMFVLANEFNQNLGSWDVSKVTNMLGMFKNTMKFNNGDVNTIKNWNVSSARDMQQMFFQAVSFNQNIGSWPLNSGGVDLRNMLDFSGIDCQNYSSTLISWNNNQNTPNNIFLGANGISFASNATLDR
ncbi:MAG: BspA family leucine-rich repeat surface protein, partial [Candidatus Paceibacterota bacterium]